MSTSPSPNVAQDPSKPFTSFDIEARESTPEPFLTRRSLAAMACEQWLASGGPDGEDFRCQQTIHCLHLMSIGMSWHVQQLSHPACASHRSRQPWMPEPKDEPIIKQMTTIEAQPVEDLQLLVKGFRRLRSSFASDAECHRLRAAATTAMVQCFRRGGQTTLSVVPSLRERLSRCGDEGAYALVHRLVERARSAAELDLRQTAQARGASAKPHECCLHHRGALLIRLSSPENALSVGAACWGFEPHQPYWIPHVDQHNVADYHVSSLLYLTS